MQGPSSLKTADQYTRLVLSIDQQQQLCAACEQPIQNMVVQSFFVGQHHHKNLYIVSSTLIEDQVQLKITIYMLWRHDQLNLNRTKH